jgi:hypothetical protein
MATFLDTTGQPTLGIGICARCCEKFPLAELFSDPNSPGLMVCEKDADQYDPYRLPARQPDRITLPFYRPDESVALDPSPDPVLTARVTDHDAETRLTDDDAAIRVVE